MNLKTDAMTCRVDELAAETGVNDDVAADLVDVAGGRSGAHCCQTGELRLANDVVHLLQYGVDVTNQVRAGHVGVAAALDVQRIDVADEVVVVQHASRAGVVAVGGLGRVTGVQIQRGNGEAGTVIIRGLGGIVTLLNGREFFTDSGRSLYLADVPATMINIASDFEKILILLVISSIINPVLLINFTGYCSTGDSTLLK